ncbi:hydroxymethylbilane synthase [Candidatus Nitrosocosmicus agrestis]|uniref:hydroxymethylbilane synthase n=1 Tax=Candidatus Nitrosocosmicus agrestis TaxID=2563600 RepID=UPI002106A06A|nr:hydroxymethylbilane synthase [Candidatus Nitrosocosmicus sp. SS]
MVATRGSKLATYQTDIITSSLKRIHKGFQFKTEKISTQGDRDTRPFYAMNQTGVFEKEVNEKLLRYEADFAVHSLKDLHAGISDKLVIACIPKRERPNDVFINNFDQKKLDQLVPNSIIGTSSIRRAIQIKTKYPHLKIKSIRGNVETRIRRSKENKFTGIILAEAGIDRLKLNSQITQRLSTNIFVPAPGQGALAIVCRKDSTEIIKILKKIEHEKSSKEIVAERTITESIGAGCTVPLGALASIKTKEKVMSLSAIVYSIDGSKVVKVNKKLNLDNPQKLGRIVAKELISKGAKELTKDWNNNTNMNIDILNELIE